MATIFHIALASEWTAAQASGSYTTSTLGRSLADEGFIHASRGDQWPRVRDTFYGKVSEPLVLLHIDTDQLDVPVVEEVGAPGTNETFPHIYGPLPRAAVLKAIPLPAKTPVREPAAAPTAESATAPTTTATPPATRRSGSPATESAQPRESFSRVYFREMSFNLLMLCLVLLVSLAGAGIGRLTGNEWGPIVGGVAGLVVGAVIAVRLFRQRHAGTRG